VLKKGDTVRIVRCKLHGDTCHRIGDEAYVLSGDDDNGYHLQFMDGIYTWFAAGDIEVVEEVHP
jgi:hypothetical protein